MRPHPHHGRARSPLAVALFDNHPTTRTHLTPSFRPPTYPRAGGGDQICESRCRGGLESAGFTGNHPFRTRKWGLRALIVARVVVWSCSVYPTRRLRAEYGADPQQHTRTHTTGATLADHPIRSHSNTNRRTTDTHETAHVHNPIVRIRCARGGPKPITSHHHHPPALTRDTRTTHRPHSCIASLRACLFSVLILGCILVALWLTFGALLVPVGSLCFAVNSGRPKNEHATLDVK